MTAAGQHDRPGTDDGGDVDLLDVVASAEPSVVFASLAARCVPALCDDCSIDIVDGTNASYSIVYPPRPPAHGGLRRLVDRAPVTADHVVQVGFEHAWQHDEARLDEQFHGIATFAWHRRAATQADRTLMRVLVNNAVSTIGWQRGEQSARDATDRADNLQVALETSRDIGTAVGILMSLKKITRDEALGSLRLASQQTNRKVRDLAVDVIDTGWLKDPTDPRRT